ncbi:MULTISPECIES: phage tail tape measure protein [Streptomyces]|uniref:phage tail tape measure protein n=1 Tax=Streptomyces TaxID=1883 RepID=UPI003687AC91
MADTSLVFNLVARDRASETVGKMGEKFNTAAATIGAGFAALLGASLVEALDLESANAKLTAQLGLGPAEAQAAGDAAASVYSHAWGENIDEVNLAIKGVYQNIGDTSQAEGGLEGVTTKVMALAEAFDQDLTIATAAAGQMVRTGLADNADEALDIIAVGLGTAADKSGDLLESLNEYSVQWKRVGLDGETSIGLINQAVSAGARDADQVSDAIGQFGERATAGGAAVDAAYKSIGLSSKDVAKMMGAGGDQAEKALSKTLTALRGTANQQVRLNAAAALFGDPANIMGDALYAMDPATAAATAGMDKATGAADKLTETMGGTAKKQLEEFKRTVMVELGQAAGGILAFAEKHETAVKPFLIAFAGLAALVVTVKVAMITYSAISSVVAGAHAIITASCWGVMGNWTRMMAMGLMAYARIAGAAVVSAATTAGAWVGSALVSIGTWIAAVVRAGLTAAAQFLLMAGRAVIWATVMAAQWLIAMGPIGWIIAAVIALAILIYANWDKIKAWTMAAWNWVWAKVAAIGTAILGFFIKWSIVGIFLRHWDRIKTGVASKAVGLIGFVAGLPGRISRAVSGLGTLLYSKGVAIVTGLWHGIQSMGPWLAGQLTGFAKSIIPGPIAKALGIHSPSRLMADVVGRWIPPGIVDGIESTEGQLAQKMGGLVQAPSPAAVMGVGRSMGGAAPIMTSGGGAQVIRIEVTGPEALKKIIRTIVRTDGRGNVQTAFGQGA